MKMIKINKIFEIFIKHSANSNLYITKYPYPRTQKSTKNNYFPENKALSEQYYKDHLLMNTLYMHLYVNCLKVLLMWVKGIINAFSETDRTE